MSTAAQKPAGSALTKSVTNVTISGTQSGKVTINSGEFSSSGTDQILEADLVFGDFSDDGQLYIGGTIDLDLSMSTPTTVDPNNPLAGLSFSFTQKGDLAFPGKYKGRKKDRQMIAFSVD
jgi:hypothetical protein